MNKFKIKYWKDGSFWIGYLIDKPDKIVKAETLALLQEKLREIYYTVGFSLKIKK